MKRQAGFTLIEMAVVIFLIGLLASMGITALKAQLINAAISATKKKQDTIKDALVSYLGRNGRLPCPDTDFTVPDGIENRGSTGTPSIPPDITKACTNQFGIIPYQILGLTKSDAMDGWEDFFSYAISNGGTPYKQNQDWTFTNPITFSFYAGNNGVISVSDGTSTPSNIVAVIISHGANGSGAYTSV